MTSASPSSGAFAAADNKTPVTPATANPTIQNSLKLTLNGPARIGCSFGTSNRSCSSGVTISAASFFAGGAAEAGFPARLQCGYDRVNILALAAWPKDCALEIT